MSVAGRKVIEDGMDQTKRSIWLNCIAVADWCDKERIDYSIQRDEIDGWFALLKFQDGKGQFSSTLDLPVSGTYSKADPIYIFDLVKHACSRAAADAHGKRCGQSLRAVK